MTTWAQRRCHFQVIRPAGRSRGAHGTADEAHPPADTGTTSNTAKTVPAAPATTVTSMTPPAGPPCTDDRAINISVVMPEGAEWNANTGYAAGRGRRYGPRRGRARGVRAGQPTPTTLPRQPRTDATQLPPAAPCQSCGYEHEVNNCVAAYAACYNCMDIGHFSRCCPTRGAPAPAQ